MNAKHEEHTIGDLYTAMSGAGHGHDEQAVGPPVQAVLGVGHEPDTFNVKPIITVPIFITFVMVAAFLITSSFFVYYKAFDRPQGTPLNQRLSRISSSDNNAEVKQPRLEWAYVTDSQRNGQVDNSSLRSVRPAEDGNSPMIRPEDLRPDNYVDPITKQKVLRDYGWANKEKSVARIPIAMAMKLMLARKDGFPVQANGSTPAVGTKTMPKLSNGGNELPVNAAKDPSVSEKKKDDHDKKDH